MQKSKKLAKKQNMIYNFYGLVNSQLKVEFINVSDVKKLAIAAVLKCLKKQREERQRFRGQEVRNAQDIEIRTEEGGGKKEEHSSFIEGLNSRIKNLDQVISSLESPAATKQIARLHESVALYSLVHVKRNGQTAYYLILPDEGGVSCEVEDIRVMSISIHSPIGMALRGKVKGEEFPFTPPQKEEQIIEVVSVC